MNTIELDGAEVVFARANRCYSREWVVGLLCGGEACAQLVMKKIGSKEIISKE